MWFIVAVYKEKKLLSENAVIMDSTRTFGDLLFEVLGYDTLDQPVVVQFYNELTKNWAGVKCDLSASLSLCEKFQPCQVKFTLKEQENLEKRIRKNVSEVEAGRTRRLPKERNFVTRHDLLYNDLIKLLKVESLGWYGECYESIGSGFVKALTNLLWYIDPHHEKLNCQNCLIPEIFLSLSQYKINSSYNLFYYAGKHKREQLKPEKLDDHLKTLDNFVTQPWANHENWKSFISNVLELCHNIRKYVSYLESAANDEMILSHPRNDPIRNLSDNITLEIRNKQRDFNVKFKNISDLLHNSDFYEFHLLDNYLPKEKRTRYEFISELRVDCTFTLYRYYHEDYLGILNFIWKIPDSISEQDKNQEVQTLTLVNEMISPYFTLQMRRNVTEKYSLVAKMVPSTWKLLYYDWAGDNSTPPHELSKEMQETMRTILDLQDADITMDLRINSGFRGTKFDIFWDELNEYFNEITPVLQTTRSISNLKNIIIGRLEQKYGKPLNSQIFIPSNEYITLQFWPGNAATNVASKYTGRFEIDYKVQPRQLSKFHVDAHYCAALFRYMRLFAIKYRNYCSLVCADNKYKIPIGEEIATSNSVDMDLSSSDHGFTKISLTPSVIFFCEIPKCISEPFHNGNAYFSYKNTIFQPCSSLSHSAEFYKTFLRQHNGDVPEILLLYTDGGVDHRNTFGSIQIALICLFLRGDFDFLASIRTPSYHSWMNPAERVMSILNLDLQGVSLQRDPMDAILEDMFKRKNILEEIRNAIQVDQRLGLQLRNSVKAVQELLSERTKRLSLNEKSFQIYTPANSLGVDEMFEAIHRIDSTLQQEEASSTNSLNMHQDLQNFIKSHCQSRTYSFQIKKCGKDDCKFCLPIRLPKDVFDELKFIPDPMLSSNDLKNYKDFNDIYGTETKESLPSASDSSKEAIPAGIIINNHIRRFINCTICSKPRCIFSKTALNDEEKIGLEILLDNVLYICGSPIIPETHSLYDKVYIRQKIHCNSPIEAVYYSCHRLKTEIICFYCGEKVGLLESDDGLKKKFATIYPFCQTCKSKGNNWPTRGKIEQKFYQ